MANRKDQNNVKDERIEDVTMYGEFIPSFDQWMTPDRQKNIAKHLEKVTELPEDQMKMNVSDEKRSN